MVIGAVWLRRERRGARWDNTEVVQDVVMTGGSVVEVRMGGEAGVEHL